MIAKRNAVLHQKPVIAGDGHHHTVAMGDVDMPPNTCQLLAER